MEPVIPSFGLLVTSTLGFKARVDSLTCVLHCLCVRFPRLTYCAIPAYQLSYAGSTFRPEFLNSLKRPYSEEQVPPNISEMLPFDLLSEASIISMTQMVSFVGFFVEFQIEINWK